MTVKPATHDAYRLMHEGTQALSRVEEAGMRIDVPYLDKALRETKEQPEEIRRGILGYGRAILVKGGKDSHIRNVMDCFRFNYFDTNDAGLLMSCYDVATMG